MDAEQLTDEIIDYWWAFFYGTFAEEDPLINFEPEKPATTGEVLAERDDFRVFVMPFGTTETKINRAGLCNVRPMVSVTVTGPIGEVTRATAIAFVDQLKLSLRRTVFDKFHWRNNDSVTYWDPDAMEVGQFRSVFRAEYVGLC